VFEAKAGTTEEDHLKAVEAFFKKLDPLVNPKKKTMKMKGMLFYVF
jgi:hypothetical protein